MTEYDLWFEKTINKYCDFREWHPLDPYDAHYEEKEIEHADVERLKELYEYYDRRCQEFTMRKLSN